MYYDDCMKISGNYPSKVIEFAKQCDIMYITNRGEIPKYKEWGVNAVFITGGCDKTAHRTVKTPGRLYQSDVAFIGKPNTSERVECMREVAKRFDLKLWGSDWERFGLTSADKDVYADGYRKICAGAKIILGWCGGFLLTLYSPSLEEIFERGRQLDWFETIEECCQKIEYYLQHSEKRKKIAQAGYELAHREYSYEKMVEKILDNLPKK
jgi:spore maturation protein CgeB